MPGLGAGHWGYIVILLVIVLIIWGPGKLPDIGSGLGRGIREFRKATSETRDEFHKATQSNDPSAAGGTAASAPGAGVTATPAPLPEPQPVGGGAAPPAPTERASGEGDHTTPV